MNDYELILFDRINVIKDVINKYGEENFYIAFSGGKDSTTLHYLIDMAIPNNKIPRVFIDTGIEYNFIREFVKELSNNDERIILIKPSQPIKQVLENYGYPFKSKQHSRLLNYYQSNGLKSRAVRVYLGLDVTRNNYKSYRPCPEILKYQFNENFKLKVSDKCCQKLKKDPIYKWAKDNNKTINITGIRAEEGGNRIYSNCIISKNGKIEKFNPLIKVDENFINWFIKTYNVKLCKLYYPPYNFIRTGCKGCPYALKISEELKTINYLLPNELKQCEIIWEPVYKEYRRIGYRLK